MSVRKPSYDEDMAPAPDVAPSSADAAASALLERVAWDQGLDVHRLDDEIVLCSDGERRVLFRGLTSSSSAKLAHVVCGNDAWLRGHLARHGLPVVPTRLVGLDDARFAQRAAEEIGYPVRMRLAGVSDEAQVRTATDEGSFHEAWRALVRTAPDPRARAILERPPEGDPVDVAVVGGEAAEVRVWLSDSGIVVDSVDPSGRAAGKEVMVGDERARALLADAFSSRRRSELVDGGEGQAVR